MQAWMWRFSCVAMLLFILAVSIQSEDMPVDSDAAFSVASERIEANRSSFFVYKDADSGFNHGFPSGKFAGTTAEPRDDIIKQIIEQIIIDAACLDDLSSPSGCSPDQTRLDRSRVNVLRISFGPLEQGDFAGVNIEEPEHWGVNSRGIGYDLRGSTHLVLDVRSPDGATVQFGVANEIPTDFIDIPRDWTTLSFPLSTLGVDDFVLPNVHILFTVGTNSDNAPNGATVLLDNIRFDPVPTAQLSALSLPVGTQTFGVVPLQEKNEGRVEVPPDQGIRNLATIYESAIAVQAMLARDTEKDRENARIILDTLHYAMRHDNSVNPIPTIAIDDSINLYTLRSGYSSGDLPLYNSQGPGSAQQGEIRLSGYRAEFCGDTKFCLVLDGTTGGNVAFAMLAFLDGYESLGDMRYLDDARILGRWIIAQLSDTTGTGFGGYFLGYPDQGIMPKTLIEAKSIENVADIFVVFTRLAAIEAQLGAPAESAMWTAQAEIAGDFVMEMFDDTTGCFFAGTVQVGTPPSPGIVPSGEQRGNDVINKALFLDANTFIAMSLAESPSYRDRIDWRKPVQCVLDKFKRTVTIDDLTFQGFSLDETTLAGPEGIAWEFTAQAVVLMRLVDRLYQEPTFEEDAAFYLNQIAHAQANDPFGDGRGLVAATLQDVNDLPPLEHCLTTPFQCIPARVGLAATVWAIFAALDINPLSPLTSQ